MPGQPADSDSIGTSWPDGTSDPDHIPRHEPRPARAAALAYGLPEPPSGEQLLRISENWRPYRTWVTLLLRTQLDPHRPGDCGRPFYSGKHHRHGMNLQVIASPGGDILWVSGPLPGAVYDLAAARIWGILRELARPPRRLPRQHQA